MKIYFYFINFKASPSSLLVFIRWLGFVVVINNNNYYYYYWPSSSSSSWIMTPFSLSFTTGTEEFPS